MLGKALLLLEDTTGGAERSRARQAFAAAVLKACAIRGAGSCFVVVLDELGRDSSESPIIG